MLNALDTKHECFPCVYEIDETTSTRKWTNKAANALNKANKDCNLTAGLEAKLTLAIGARVMLRRNILNIDTKNGLVNGSIGSVTAMTSNAITVKFDHIAEPYCIERVKSKFMLMKAFYVYRKQFPLILAYAVTIQGLSLDSAIIDLSSKVFSPGMAYVALSRVRTLNGVHLTDFDPASITVSTNCLEEINRLRTIYRKDLSLL